MAVSWKQKAVRTHRTGPGMNNTQPMFVSMRTQDQFGQQDGTGRVFACFRSQNLAIAHRIDHAVTAKKMNFYGRGRAGRLTS
jgi:hypothetical protein